MIISVITINIGTLILKFEKKKNFTAWQLVRMSELVRMANSLDPDQTAV